MASNHHKVHISNFQNENQEDTACGGNIDLTLGPNLGDQESSNIDSVLQSNLCCLKVLLHYSGFDVSTEDTNLEIKCRFCNVKFRTTDGEHFDFDIPENKNGCINNNCNSHILETILKKHLHTLDSGTNQSVDKSRAAFNYQASDVSDIFQNGELIDHSIQLINIILKLHAELKQKNLVLKEKDLKLDEKDSVIKAKDSELREKEDKIESFENIENLAVSRWHELLIRIEKLNTELQEKSKEILRLTEEKSNLEKLVMNCHTEHIDKKELKLLEEQLLNSKIESGMLQLQLRDEKEKNKNTDDDYQVVDKITMKKKINYKQTSQEVKPVMEQQNLETEMQNTGRKVNQPDNTIQSSCHRGTSNISSSQSVNQHNNPVQSSYKNINQFDNSADSGHQAITQPENSANFNVNQPDTPTKPKNKKRYKNKKKNPRPDSGQFTDQQANA